MQTSNGIAAFPNNFSGFANIFAVFSRNESWGEMPLAAAKKTKEN